MKLGNTMINIQYVRHDAMKCACKISETMIVPERMTEITLLSVLQKLLYVRVPCTSSWLYIIIISLPPPPPPPLFATLATLFPYFLPLSLPFYLLSFLLSVLCFSSQSLFLSVSFLSLSLSVPFYLSLMLAYIS